jgi:putative membrane protein
MKLGPISLVVMPLFLGGPVLAASADQQGHTGPTPGSNSEAISATKDTIRGAVGTISAEMTTTTKGFVTAAATSDLYEVEASKIAIERTHSQRIKSFAQDMVKAHTASSTELKGILATNTVNVTPPAHVDDRRQGMLDTLRGAKDEDFDGRYLEQQESAHKEALILMRGYAKDGDSTQLKAFAAKMEPVVQQHLAMVETLEKNNQDMR